MKWTEGFISFGAYVSAFLVWGGFWEPDLHNTAGFTFFAVAILFRNKAQGKIT